MSEVVYMVVMSSGSYDLHKEWETYVTVSLEKAEKHVNYLANKVKDAANVIFDDICTGCSYPRLPDDFAAPEHFHQIVNVALSGNDIVEISIYRLPMETPLGVGRQLVSTVSLTLEKYSSDILWNVDDDSMYTPAVPYEDVEADILGEH